MSLAFRVSAPNPTCCSDPEVLCTTCRAQVDTETVDHNFRDALRRARAHRAAAQPAPVRKTADEWLNHYLERYNLAPPPPSVEEHLRSRRTDPSTKELRRTKTSKKELRRTKLAAPVPPSEEEPRTLAAASDEVPPPPDLNAILREARRR